MLKQKTLVLGGRGLLGNAIEKVVDENWIFVSSVDGDLTKESETKSLLEYYKQYHGVNRVLNLAAKVGGIELNTNHQYEMYETNSRIVSNVIKQCMKQKIDKLGTCLSTCVFPNYPVEKYPISEEDFYGNVSPPPSNLGYAIAKRNAYELTLIARQSGFDYITFAPTNLFGPHDNFNPLTSHFIAATVRKAYDAADGSTVDFYGVPRTLRQHLFSKDAAKMIVQLFNNYSGDKPVIVTSDSNLTNEYVIQKVIEVSRKDLQYTFNGKYPGQFRKDCSNSLLKSLVVFEETDFTVAVKETYDFYSNLYINQAT